MLTGTNIIRKLQQENIRLQTENTALNKNFNKSQHTIQALVKLQRSLQSIQPETNVFDLINQVVTSVLTSVDSENGSLSLLDENTGELVFVEVLGDARDRLLNFKLPEGDGVGHWCIKNKKPRLVEDIRRDPIISPSIDNTTIAESTSLICIPLILDDRPLGTIEVVNTTSGQAFTPEDLDIMMVVGHLAAMIIATAEKMQE